jgi:hypothetical protein
MASVDRVPKFACKNMQFDIVLGYVRVKKWPTNTQYVGIIWDSLGNFRAIKLEVRRGAAGVAGSGACTGGYWYCWSP